MSTTTPPKKDIYICRFSTDIDIYMIHQRMCQRVKWQDGITNAMDMKMGKLREMVKDREASVLPSMGLQRVRYDWATKRQQQKYTIYYNHATKLE